MKPIVLESSEDLNELIRLIMRVNQIPEGKGVAMLLGDFSSCNNFEAVKRWTIQTLWQTAKEQDQIVLNELCELLKNALQKGLLDVEPTVIHH